MKYTVACILTLFVASVAMAQSVEVRLDNGKVWRGEVSDVVVVEYKAGGVPIEFQGRLLEVKPGLYIKVEGNVTGLLKARTIFIGDILSLREVSEDSEEAASLKDARRPAKDSGKGPEKSDGTADRDRGIFVLPLEGPVGTMFRYDEVKKIGEYADTFGHGQIIVLKIKSNGGSVAEAELIAEEIAEIQKRHRVIAWIDKAISAGCSTAMATEEIYFMTTGSAGSVTTLMGNRSVPEDFVFPDGTTMRQHVERFARMAERNGYSPHIARAMKFNHYMCSYDKDPVTGEVTFYGDMSGEHILSDDESNLSFNSSNAEHCGFSKGTADTVEELAAHLDLDKWQEMSDYGRQIAEDWQQTAKRTEEDILHALVNYQVKNTGTGDPVKILGARIQSIRDLLRAWRLAPNIARSMGLPPEEALERELAELKKRLADLKRERR